MECKIVIRNDLLSMENDNLHQFMIVRPKVGKWIFPKVLLKRGEALIQACKRGFVEVRERANDL